MIQISVKSYEPFFKLVITFLWNCSADHSFNSLNEKRVTYVEVNHTDINEYHLKKIFIITKD